MAVANLKSTTPQVSISPSKTPMVAMAVVTTLFFMWGFLTQLNDILIPHLKAIFDLSYKQALLIQFSFFCAYLIFGIPSGKIVERIGYKKTMVAGLLTMAAGAFLLIAAAGIPSYPVFLAALIVLGVGITTLQTAANPYVTVLGPENTASSRLNLTQAFNSLGTTVAPLLGGLLILSAATKTAEEMRSLSAAALHAYRLQQASSVKLPYLGLGLVLVALGIVIARFNLPPIPGAEKVKVSGAARSLWQHKNLVLGAIGIFVYVGAEVSIGSFLVNYLSQPSIGDISERAAAGYLTFYWGGAMVGRFIGSALLQKIRTGKLLGFNAIVACALVITTMLTFGHIAMWTILSIGLFNSIMFPSIFTLGLEGLGPLTGEGSGILVTAIVGGAVIPELQGIIADRIGIHHAFFLPAFCYLYIAYFALRSVRGAPVRATAQS